MIDELSFQSPFVADDCLATGEFSAAAVAGIVEGFAGCVAPFEAAAAYFHWTLTAGAGSDCQESCTNGWKTLKLFQILKSILLGPPSYLEFWSSLCMFIVNSCAWTLSLF